MLGIYGISDELIEWLEETFPNVLPMKDCTTEELAFLQGQQNIINVIKSTYKESLENVYAE
tara:strand:- start:493 stop:675 length:183 start_codon:yes stop_codon:yes gene_type:complete